MFIYMSVRLYFIHCASVASTRKNDESLESLPFLAKKSNGIKGYKCYINFYNLLVVLLALVVQLMLQLQKKPHNLAKRSGGDVLRFFDVFEHYCN